MEAAARRAPNRPALVWEHGMLTYAGLLARAGGFAATLERAGVNRGQRVAVVTPSGPDVAVAVLGGLAHGVTVAPLDPLLTADERAAILSDLEPARIVDRVDTRVADLSVRPAQAPALVLYTSGTTGQPKGAVLSHAALRFAIESWAGPVMRLHPGDVVLAALPLSHSFGLNGALLAPLVAGAAVALVERFTPATALAAIARHRVTVFPGVATMFQRILAAPEMATSDLGSLRLVVSGAAPCPWVVCDDWRKRTGVRILRGYGMSEVFRPISYLDGDDDGERPDAIGRAVPGVELRVVDDGGRDLAPGDAGELWIKTPAAMDGYLNATADSGAVLVDGWFRTGDLVTLSRDGYVRIVGRKRERILRGGYSVFPAEVEAVLLSHPAVAEAAVVGQPHAELGEEVAGFVTLRDGHGVQPDELVGYCRERLTMYKYPRTVTILGEMPKSATGKVLKARLAQRTPRA